MVNSLGTIKPPYIICISYTAHFMTEGNLNALHNIIPWSLGQLTLLKPSQLPGEYTAPCCYLSAQRLIKHKAISTLTGTHFTPGWREAISDKASCPRTQAPQAPWLDSNPQSVDWPQDLEYDAPDHSATALHIGTVFINWNFHKGLLLYIFIDNCA